MHVHRESQPAEGSDCASPEWEQTYQLVRQLLIDEFGITASAIAPATRMDEDLVMDSLELVDFGLILNRTQRIDLGVDVLELAYTVEDLVNLVHATRLERRASLL